MVICLERGADLHMAQLMPLPLTVSCFSKIQIGFTFLVPADPGSPGQRAVKLVCVCVCVCVLPELVKHILVAGVVGRNVKIDAKISNVGNNHTRAVLFCGGCRSDAKPCRK